MPEKVDLIELIKFSKMTEEPIHESQSINRFDVNPLWTYETDEEENGIIHLSLSPNNQELSLSQWNGTINIVSSRTGRISYSIPFLDKNAVVNCTKFHPKEKLLLCSGTSGHVCLCKYQTSNFTWATRNADDVTYSCAFSMNGDTFMTGGKNATVNLYDTQTTKIIHSFSFNDESCPYHSSRIYCVTNDSNDNNRFVTGGWDQRVIIWDIRQPQSSVHIGGPNICGDSIDIFKNSILTGSWRAENQLEIWDIKTCKLLKKSCFSKTEQCQIYGAKFSKNKGTFAAGGSDASYIRVFDYDMAHKERLGFFNSAVTSVALSDDGTIVFAASQNGKCYAFSS